MTSFLLLPLFYFASTPNGHAADPKENQQVTMDASTTADNFPALSVSGITIELFAEHPDLATPTGIDVADDGSVWIASNHTHFRPAGYQGPEKDEILCFAPDGTRTVFFSDTNNTMDLELGRSNDIYLAQRDKLIRLFGAYPGGKCNQTETIIRLETEATYPHNGLSGLTWAPDGRLVFSIGENFAKPWKLMGSDGITVSGSGEGGVFSCLADGSGLRRIAKGFWNPFGLCFRDGELFAAENDPGSRPPCRLLHVVQNGDYGYQRKYGNAAHHPFVCWNGELRGTLPMMHALGEAPCGIIPFQNGLAVTSWTEHRIDYYPLKQSGETFSTHRVTMVEGDRNFRPTCIAMGNDHDIFFTDWVKGSYEIHGQGRVWKLSFDPTQTSQWTGQGTIELFDSDQITSQRKTANRIANMNIAELFTESTSSSDPFLRHKIICELAQRLDQDAKEILSMEHQIAQIQDDQSLVLLLVWKMARPKDVRTAQMFLNHSSRAVQFEALRWIADEELAELLPTVSACLEKSDIDFDLLEATLATINTLNGNPEQEIADESSLTRFFQSETTSNSLQASLLRLMRPSQESFGLEEWLEIKREGNEMVLRELIRTVSTAASDQANRFLREILEDPSIPNAARADAIASFQPSNEQDIKRIVSFASSKAVSIREEALRSLRHLALDEEDRIFLRELKDDYPKSAPLINAALEPETIKKNHPANDDLSSWNQLLDHVEEPVDLAAGQRIFNHPRIANCSKCHRHTGRGNLVGPDLTNLGRNIDRDRILTSLLLPSEQIDPQFQGRSLLLEDGKTFSGILLRDGGGGNEVYRNLDGNEQVIKTDDIIQRKETSTSLMPEGLLDQLTIREIRDLLAFLSQQPINGEIKRSEKTKFNHNWIGDWWFNFPDGYGGWLSLSEANPNTAQLLWRVGAPRSVAVETLAPNRLRLTKSNKKSQTEYIAVFDDRRIKIRETKEDPTTASGGKCPPMPARPNLETIKFGESISLFNGRNLDGWELHPKTAKNGWKAQDRMLINITPKTDFGAYGDHGNLRTKETFDDCQLHIEFKVDENCNSGVYINGLYEAQVVDRNSKMQGINGPGAIFGRIAPKFNAGLPGGEWQTYDITLVDRHITVVLNGKKVIDNQPVIGCTGGALFGNVTQPGPVYLQGDHTSVSYRNVSIRRRLVD
ncbi:DUF1080 domain-containing protein [Rubripirellula sp.]|nr:DUF1080 domain-containing protein [Rubripirellula sp.]